MPTVCELRIEAKKKGLKGYSKLNKAQLQALVNRAPARAPVVATPVRAPVMATPVRAPVMATPVRAQRGGVRLPRPRNALYGTGRNPYD